MLSLPSQCIRPLSSLRKFTHSVCSLPMVKWTMYQYIMPYKKVHEPFQHFQYERGHTDWSETFHRRVFIFPWLRYKRNPCTRPDKIQTNLSPIRLFLESRFIPQSPSHSYHASDISYPRVLSTSSLYLRNLFLV